MVSADDRYPVSNPNYWQLGEHLHADFGRERFRAERALQALDPDSRRHVFETHQVFGEGRRALEHLTGTTVNQAASMSGWDAAVHEAMAADPAAPDPGDAWNPTAGRTRPSDPSLGPGTTWWEGERFAAYQAGHRSMLADIAKLNRAEVGSLLSRIGSQDTGRNGVIEADFGLREQFGDIEAHDVSAVMARPWIEGRQDALREWRQVYTEQGQAATAALGGQLAPGSGPAATPRTPPNAANAAAHRYPSAGSDRDRGGR